MLTSLAFVFLAGLAAAAICQQLHFTSLEYQSLDELIKAIGREPCKVCTYCWNGKE